MENNGYARPFYVVDVGSNAFAVGSEKDGKFNLAFACDGADSAEELALSLNVTWQKIVYGRPDPSLWREFYKAGLYTGHGQPEIFEMFEAFEDAGIMPDGISFSGDGNDATFH